LNQARENYLRLFEEYQDLKDAFIAIVSDEDLAHQITGSPTLGELSKEVGETEQSYINSFKPPYKLNFQYRNPDASLTKSVSGLAAWYANMDKEFKGILDGFSDEEWESVIIHRGTWPAPLRQNLDIYKEALLIFCGKAWVHLHALGKSLPEQWEEWIG